MAAIIPSPTIPSPSSSSLSAPDQLGSYYALDLEDDNSSTDIDSIQDLEKHHILYTSRKSPLTSGWFWLLLYLIINLIMTLQNKILLTLFPYPFTMTSVHIFVSGMGSLFMQWKQKGDFSFMFFRSKSTKTLIILILYSILYTINVAMSNVSLGIVSIPLHQVVRSMSPFFIVIISIFLVPIPIRVILSCLPVVLGVGLATYGNYECTFMGMLITIIGTLLASLKSVVTNIILGGNLSRKFEFARISLTPSELLFWTFPLAFLQCISYANGAGEISAIHQSNEFSKNFLLIFSNGLVAFALNYVSLTANKACGALAVTIAANVKQVLVILLATAYFHTVVSPLNALGITICVAGGALYAYAEHTSKDPDIQIKQLINEKLKPMP